MYRVGIIGTGRIAGSIQDEIERLPLTFLLPYSHAGAYAAVPSTRLVAAADPSADRLREFAARWQVDATYADYRTMLDKEHLNIVSICTPTSTHIAIAANHSRSNCHGRSGRGGEPLSHVRPVLPPGSAVDRQRAIGELHSITAHWAGGMLFGGTHLFDTLRFLTGDEASWVFSRLDAGDGVFDRGGTGMLGMRSGVSVFIDNAVGNSVVCEFDIVGSLGRIRVGNTLFPELYTLDPDCSMALTRRAFPASVVAKSPMTVAVEELIRALETGEPPASDLSDARSDLELSVAFHLADRARRVVSLPITELDYSITDLWGRYA